MKQKLISRGRGAEHSGQRNSENSFFLEELHDLVQSEQRRGRVEVAGDEPIPES